MYLPMRCDTVTLRTLCEFLRMFECTMSQRFFFVFVFLFFVTLDCAVRITDHISTQALQSLYGCVSSPKLDFSELVSDFRPCLRLCQTSITAGNCTLCKEGFVSWLFNKQSGSKERICSDTCRYACCHTEIESADQLYLTHLHYIDTGSTQSLR